MGLGGVSIWQLLIIFAVVILVFGTSKLKSLGGDLGGAIKGFRKALENDDGGRSSPSAGGEAHRIEAAAGANVDVAQRSESGNHV